MGGVQEDVHSNWHVKSLLKRASRKSFWYSVFETMGMHHHFPIEPKMSGVRRLVLSRTFGVLCTLATLLNAFIMGWEADVTIKKVLANPPGDGPMLFQHADIGFTCFFTVELCLR